MPNCDICGKQGELFETLVEGVKLALCSSCSSFGRVVNKPSVVFTKPKKSRTEITENIIADAGLKIRTSREHSSLTQEEFAKKLNIKISLLSRIESGQMLLDIQLAKKLEKLLQIKLVESEAAESQQISAKGKVDTLTIGDVVEF